MDGRRVEVVPFSALRWRGVRTDDHLLTPTSFATVSSSFLFESRLSGCWGVRGWPASTSWTGAWLHLRVSGSRWGDGWNTLLL